MTDMSKGDLAALKASILHWEENVAAKTPDEAGVQPEDCALCQKFWRRDSCIGCPVARRTGQSYCEGSPYLDAVDALTNWENGTGSRKAFRKAAKAEVEFLKSLLPPEKHEPDFIEAHVRASRIVETIDLRHDDTSAQAWKDMRFERLDEDFRELARALGYSVERKV